MNGKAVAHIGHPKMLQRMYTKKTTLSIELFFFCISPMATMERNYHVPWRNE